MVDVAEELGVDAIGLNHLMFSTPEEVAETVRMIGADGRVGDRHVRHAGSGPGHRRASSSRWPRSPRSAGERNVLFDFRPKVHPQLMDNYYTPGAKLEGRCLYPFLHARVSVLRQGLLLPVHPRRSRRPRDVVARRNLERTRRTSRCGDGCSITASFRSAGAAARSSCRRNRWLNRSRRRRSAARDSFDGRLNDG